MKDTKTLNIFSVLLLLVLCAVVSIPSVLFAEDIQLPECSEVSSERAFVLRSIRLCEQSAEVESCMHLAAEAFKQCNFTRTFHHHQERIQKGMLLVMLLSQGATVSPARASSGQLD